MCGIVGVATAYTNGFSSQEASAFLDMLYFDALRGMDSTGVFGVDKHANVQIHKEASQAGHFIQAKELREFKTELIRRGMFAVGHNRAATRGKVNDTNAHPFWIDDKIVLVQNGTYRGDHSHHKATEVDTEAVAHVIAENEDIATALQKINAAYALVWFNTDKKTLYLIRNDERPLYMAWANQCLLWCSDPGFLYLAASRNQLTLTSPPEMLPAHELVELKIEGNQWEYSSAKIDGAYKAPPFRYEPHEDNIYPMAPYRWRHGYSQQDDGDIARKALGYDRHVKSPVEVDHMLSEVLIEKFPELHIPVNEINDIKARIQAWHMKDQTRNYPIQVTDYEPANTHPHCTTWHVWGTFGADFDVFHEKVVAHWFVYKKTEAEMLEYTDNEFATAKISAVRSHVKNGVTGVITIFMMDVKQFDTVKVVND